MVDLDACAASRLDVLDGGASLANQLADLAGGHLEIL